MVSQGAVGLVLQDGPVAYDQREHEQDDGDQDAAEEHEQDRADASSADGLEHGEDERGDDVDLGEDHRTVGVLR